VVDINNRIASDPEYQKHFEQFKTIWNASRNLAEQSTVDENAAWQRFKNRVTYKEQQETIEQKHQFGWRKVAASVFALVGIGLAILLITNQQNANKTIVFQSFQQVLNDTLSDASVITLNKNSTLTHPKKFAGNTRLVTLKGEAFFKISPNAQKPFIIAINDLQVKVVGTSFNIKETNGNTEIVVETGIVQVSRKGKTVELIAGEKLNSKNGTASMVKEPVKDKLYNYYRTKEFACEETPLWKLVEILNEAYHANIIIGNSAIRSLPITTTFYNESLDQVLLIISETLNITVVKKDNNIVLQ
jgi:transmembrane sensor